VYFVDKKAAFEKTNAAQQKIQPTDNTVGCKKI